LHTYFVSDSSILVHNTCERPYSPSPKHEPGGWGTEMDLDSATAQRVLSEGILGPNGRQVYGYHNGKMYEFQPDNVGAYHGYPVPGNEVPTAVLRTLRDAKIITRSEYGRFLRGKA
jgi:filamentous hemagglutinin